MRLAEFSLGLCFGASAVHLINDLAHFKSKRRHKETSRQPIASGALPIPWALSALPVCLALAVFFCSVAGWPAVALLAAFLAAAGVCSFCLARVALFHILCCSALCVYRLIAGAILAPVALSPLLWTFAMMLFLGLAVAKRYGKLGASF
jgi:4-hydroxybenzoate polyprenyltransferase